MTNPSQPTGMMLDEILEKYKRSFTGNPGIYKTKAETIAAIQALVEEAIPEKQYDLGQAVYVENTGGKHLVGWIKEQETIQDKHGTGSDYMDGFNAALTDLRSRLMRAGLVKKE